MKKSEYCKFLADELCARISSGRTLSSVVKDPDMPEMSVVRLWQRMYPEFKAALRSSYEDLCLFWADEIVTIADDANSAKDKFRVEARQWLMSKFYAEIFSEKQTVKHEGNVNVTHGIDAPRSESREEWLARKSREAEAKRIELTGGLEHVSVDADRDEPRQLLVMER